MPVKADNNPEANPNTFLEKRNWEAVENFSIEVMPRTAEKIIDFKNFLPKKTKVYIAHIEGSDINSMLTTARRLIDSEMTVIPHFPARLIKNSSQLEEWVKRYGELGVNHGLVLAGGVKKPVGDFSDSMQLIETSYFDKYGFKNIYFAGHPEGNKDIDKKGSDELVMKALQWKRDFSLRTDAKIELTTQFCFEIGPIIDWEVSLRNNGINFPINLGVAGPAKLQTMIKFAILCGIGPSIRVLERRAKDLTKLFLPYSPSDFLSKLIKYKSENPETNIKSIHFFPLGGILQTGEFIKSFFNEKTHEA